MSQNTKHQVGLPDIESVRAYSKFLDVLISWEKKGLLNFIFLMKDGWHP